jgi:hypothetical protein
MDERLIALLEENGYSNEEIAAVICAYEYYDMTEEDIENLINDGDIESDYESVYGNGKSVRVGDIRFGVYENDGDAYDAAKEWFEDLVDEIGVAQAVPDYVWKNYLDEDSCEEFFRDDYRSYCEDIVNEDDDTYGNRLVSECYDAGIIDDYDFEEDEDGEPDYSQCAVDEDDLIEKYVDYMVDRIDDFGEEIKFQFGEDALEDLIKRGYIEFDMEGLTDRYIDDCGVGGCLSGYDGYEHEVEYDDYDYYVYRMG